MVLPPLTSTVSHLPGQEYVISRYRGENLCTQFERIIKRAGLQPWPKLFQNLLASRETELTQQFPLHFVCTWIGNSEIIAAKHYLQVTDDHFYLAVQDGAKSGAVDGPTVQNAVQQRAAPSRSVSQETQKTTDNTVVFPDLAIACVTEQAYTAPPRGVEPLSLD